MNRAHPIELEEVIEHLRLWREGVESQLRSPETHAAALKQKRQIDTAIGCLELCQRFQIRPTAKVTRLPDTQTQTPSSDFRLIEDHESDHKEDWVEVRINGERFYLYPDDLIIQ